VRESPNPVPTFRGSGDLQRAEAVWRVVVRRREEFVQCECSGKEECSGRDPGRGWQVWRVRQWCRCGRKPESPGAE